MTLKQGMGARNVAFKCLQMAALSEQDGDREKADHWRAHSATAFRAIAAIIKEENNRMGCLYDKVNQEQGLRVRVYKGSNKGPYWAKVQCAVTGRVLAYVEQCVSIQQAATSGWRKATDFMF